MLWFSSWLPLPSPCFCVGTLQERRRSQEKSFSKVLAQTRGSRGPGLALRDRGGKRSGSQALAMAPTPLNAPPHRKTGRLPHGSKRPAQLGRKVWHGRGFGRLPELEHPAPGKNQGLKWPQNGVKDLGITGQTKRENHHSRGSPQKFAPELRNSKMQALPFHLPGYPFSSKSLNLAFACLPWFQQAGRETGKRAMISRCLQQWRDKEKELQANNYAALPHVVDAIGSGC